MYRYFDVHSHKSHPQSDNDTVVTIENIRICNNNADLISSPYFSVGIHPYDAEKVSEKWFLDLETIASNDRCLAIGECGIDKRYPDEKLQSEILYRHIDLSNRLHKPLIIHCVKAENEILNALKRSTEKTIFHSYAHFDQQMERASNVTLSLSERSLQNPTIHRIPTSRMLLETDDGGMSIEQIYAKYSKLLGIDPKQLQTIIYDNFTNIFNTL